MKKYLLFEFLVGILVLILLPTNLRAQSMPLKLWDKTVGGNKSDNLWSLQQTSDGGYILGGTSNSDISGDKSQSTKGKEDYWVVKLDAAGNKQWDKTLGGSNSDNLRTLQQTSDGGYILGGYSDSGISGDKTQPCLGGYDYWLVKLDAAGNKTWDKTFGSNNYDGLLTLQQTTDGGFILGGASYGSANGDKSELSRGDDDFWVIKVDSIGQKIWDKTIGGNSYDVLLSILQSSDGGFILGGFTESGYSGDKSQASKGGRDYWLVKLNASGVQLWDRTFGGNDFDYFNMVKETSDGGYILGGYSKSGISGDRSQPSQGDSDYWIVKLDGSGNKIWDRAFGGNSADALWALQQTTDGGYILGGTSSSGIGGDKTQASKGFADYWVVKLDVSGNKIWDNVFGGSKEDALISLQQTADGGYILGGVSESLTSGDKSQSSKGRADYWVVKIAIPPVVSAGPAETICANSLPVQLSGFSPVGGVWSGTGVSASGIFTPSSSMTGVINLTYTVTQNDLIVSASKQITVTPISQISLGSDIAACDDTEITLQAEDLSGTYLWSDGSNGSSMKVRQSGIYWVSLTKDGCISTDSIKVVFRKCPETFIPNIITQNQDGKNDIFQPQYLQKGKWELQIYNRWGVKLFEAEDYQNNWPDKKIADGTYYYQLKNYETGQRYKGWVEVLQ